EPAPLIPVALLDRLGIDPRKGQLALAANAHHRLSAGAPGQIHQLIERVPVVRALCRQHVVRLLEEQPNDARPERSHLGSATLPHRILRLAALPQARELADLERPQSLGHVDPNREDWDAVVGGKRWRGGDESDQPAQEPNTFLLHTW